MANAATLKIEIGVDDKGSPVIKGFGDQVEKSSKKSSRTLGALNKDLGCISRGLLNIKTLAASAFVGWGLSRLSGSLIQTASGMEQLEMSLDTITKGRGQEWFQELNTWAMTMPVNTQKAIDSFKLMRAMGLEPTINQMTTLVDTMAAIGGGEETLEGIARALGQIQTKGKVSAEELMQLAERGVPAYQILAEKLNLTGEQVANIGNQGISANQAIQALLEGMTERFGGMSEKMESTWKGIMEGLKAYWMEFQRLVMESGAFTVLKETLGEIRDKIGEIYNDGRLAEWAAKTGASIANTIATIVEVTGYIPAAWYTAKEAASEFLAFLTSALKGIHYILQRTPAGLYVKLMDKAAKWLGADNSLFSKPQEFLDSMGKAIDDFAMAQLDGADRASVLARHWMDIGIQVEGFADNLRDKVSEAADEIAQSGEKAASAIGQANQALAQSTVDMSAKAIDGIIKTAQADLDAVNDRLNAYRSFYDQVTAMSDRAREQEAAHIKELMALEKARANANKQTDSLVLGLRQTTMTDREKYQSSRSALNHQYTEAMRLEGQEQIRALQAYQQAVSSLANQYAQGVTQTTVSFGQATEQTVISSKDVIADAVSDIERAGSIIDRAFSDMETAKERQIRADQAWADSLASTAQDAAYEIEYLSGLANRLAAQIEAMETEIAIMGKDEVSPVVWQIQAELDSLHDKTVTITTIHRDVYQGQASTPDPNSIMGSYAGGTRFVPQTGLYVLHKGEEVTPAHKVQPQGGNVSVGEIHINIPHGTQVQNPEDWRAITRNIIVPELQRLGRG